MDPLVYNQAVAGDNYVKVLPNRRHLLATYGFTVTATALGGATYTSPELNITTCGLEVVRSNIKSVTKSFIVNTKMG
jgi:hypothetical protein